MQYTTNEWVKRNTEPRQQCIRTDSHGQTLTKSDKFRSIEFMTRLCPGSTLLTESGLRFRSITQNIFSRERQGSRFLIQLYAETNFYFWVIQTSQETVKEIQLNGHSLRKVTVANIW